MDSESRKSTLTFPSVADGAPMHALLWEPAESSASSPRAIVQIVHGMAEHIERYDEFARFLAGHGFVVCGDDHIGHGRSASGAEDLGHMEPDGKEALIGNVDTLRRLVQQRYAPGTPYFLFGHSMGSFITRAYLARPFAKGLAGAVICGTGQQPRMLSSVGNKLSRLFARLRGPRFRSKFIDGLGAGAYAKQIPDARTPFDWLSTDPAVVDAFIADPQCGQMFTVGGYAVLTDLTGEIADPARVAHIPNDLPLLFIAGSEDPVGACGKGVGEAINQIRCAGVRHIERKMYKGMRHEILNEPGRAQVYADVLRWLDWQIDPPADEPIKGQPVDYYDDEDDLDELDQLDE